MPESNFFFHFSLQLITRSCCRCSFFWQSIVFDVVVDVVVIGFIVALVVIVVVVVVVVVLIPPPF